MIDREKQVFTLSEEGKRIFEKRLKNDKEPYELDGVEVYIDKKQKTPIKLRNKEVFLAERALQQ